MGNHIGFFEKAAPFLLSGGSGPPKAKAARLSTGTLPQEFGQKVVKTDQNDEKFRRSPKYPKNKFSRRMETAARL